MPAARAAAARVRSVPDFHRSLKTTREMPAPRGVSSTRNLPFAGSSEPSGVAAVDGEPGLLATQGLDGAAGGGAEVGAAPAVAGTALVEVVAADASAAPAGVVAGAGAVACSAAGPVPRCWPITTMATMPATIEKIATVMSRRRGLGALAGRPAGAWLFISVGPWVR